MTVLLYQDSVLVQYISDTYCCHYQERGPSWALGIGAAIAALLSVIARSVSDVAISVGRH